MPTKRQKGGHYERTICRQLSAWWRPGRDDVFWRTGGSGGRATRRGRRGDSTFGQYGDVCATDPAGRRFLFLFTVEIKAGYSKFSPFDLIDREQHAAVQTFESWCVQAMESATHARTPLWLVISRRSQRRAVAAFPQNLITRLARKDLPSMGRLLAVTPRMTMTVPVRVSQQQTVTTNVVIMPLDDFLRALSPLDVKALTEKPI